MKQKSYLLLFIVFISDVCAAYSEDSLWLPISYESYRPKLIEAAEKVSENEYCNHLLDGTFSESLSSPNKTIFIFRCRTNERRLFTITVDANTLAISSSLEGWIKQQKLEAQRLRQIEEQRLQEEQRRLEEQRLQEEQRLIEEQRKKIAEREQYWGICKRLFNRKASLFNDAKVLTEFPPQPDISDDGVFTYYIEFQTLSSKKTVLSYLATAVISSLDGCDIEIRPI